MSGLVITNSTFRLNWLSSIKGGRVVQPPAAGQMSELRTMEQAQAFVRSAGLQIVPHIQRIADSANSVTVLPPRGLDEYYGPQIVLPKVAADILPFGSALINCLIPDLPQREAESTLLYFQQVVAFFSERVGALPFACITGHMAAGPLSHNLYQRGFRFFFSPAPDRLFDRILQKLYTYFEMIEEPQAPVPPAEKELATTMKSLLAANYQELCFCRSGSEKIGHAILEDIKAMTFGTVLVRFDQ